MPQTENHFQADIIRELKAALPDCLILKQDPNYCLGIPDLLILYRNRWASLEIKRNENAPHRPNQDYYIDIMNKMSFAAFCYPENKDDVLKQLLLFFTR